MRKLSIKLTPTTIDAIKKSGKYYDLGRHGLFIRARRSEAKNRDGELLKRWYQKVKIRDTWVEKPIGHWPVVTLAVARKRALANAQILEAGGDPWETKAPVPTLAEAVERHLKVRGVGKGRVYISDRRQLLKNHAPGLLGRKIDEITRQDVIDVLAPIWEAHFDAATRLQGVLSMTFKWANTGGHRGDKPDNPADGDLRSHLPDNAHEVRNHPSLPFQEVKGFLDRIDEAEYLALASRLALKFKVLTGLRSEEVVAMSRDEIDLEREIFKPQDESLPSLYWPCLVIPAERTKTGREYVIPLSIPAIQVLLEAGQLSHLHPYLVFPGMLGQVLSHTSLYELHKRFSDTVPHGLRDSIRSWGQTYRINDDVMETVLGHSIATHQGAYGRSILAGIRIYLMHDWAQYNTVGLPKGYRWEERFFPEEPDTYPDENVYMVREDVEALRRHQNSGIAEAYYRSIQETFESLRTGEIYPAHQLAVTFMALTGAKPTFVVRARVSDVDVDSRTWTIPAEDNGTSGLAMQVPLSAPAMEVYTKALTLPHGNSSLLFPSRRGNELEARIFARVCKSIGAPFGPPVLRFAFREWAWKWGYPEGLIAQALGIAQSQPLFVEDDPTAGAARDWRTRVRMMNEWSDFLHGKRR